MNDLTIGIAYELEIENAAKELETLFADRQYKTRLLAKKRFPIADPMHPFLCGLSENFDLAFILISDSNNSRLWILRELIIFRNGGYFQNVYPVFLTKADVPSWWDYKEQNFITMDALDVDFINSLIDRVRR